MIQDIFIPQKIGSFYIFTQRTLSIKIEKTAVLALVVAAHGKRRKIEQVIKEPIGLDPLVPYQERVDQTVAAVLAKAGSATTLVTSISSALVIFKEISVPLMGYQKIKMIVPFEIEPLLPFSLDQAAVDALITREDRQTNTAHLIAGAVKRDLLHNTIAPLTNAKRTINRITTDIIELYSLSKALRLFTNSSGGTAILYGNPETIQMGFIVGQELVAVRSLHQGIQNLLQVPGSDGIPQESNKAFETLTSTMATTYQTILQKRSEQPPLQKVILCGELADLRGLQEHCKVSLDLSCDLLTTNKILYTEHILNNSKTVLTNEFLIPLAAALAQEGTEDFNLNQTMVEQSRDSLITTQVIAFFALTILLLGSFFTYSWVTQRSFKQEIKASEQEAIGKLRQQLTLPAGKDQNDLKKVIVAARQELLRKENIWFALSSANRSSFLSYLQDLSTRINRDTLGLELRQLAINEESNTITLEGQVKNFEALRTLEEDLSQSPLFETVSKPQELKFTIRIALKNPHGDL